MASKKTWKKRAKGQEEARRLDQARAFEAQSKLAAQLRTVDHILTNAELPGPTAEALIAQFRALFERLRLARQTREEQSYEPQDLADMRSSYSLESYQRAHARFIEQMDLDPCIPSQAPPEPVDFKLYGEDDTNPANILKDSPKGHA